jgi:hypothetical protein
MTVPSEARPSHRIAEPVRFLRGVLVLDAAASGAMGLMLLFAPAAVRDLLGLPGWLTSGAGLSLLPFAAFVAWTATRESPPRVAVWAIVALNVLWVVDSIATVAGGFVAASGLGVAFVLVQAAAVAAFAVLEIAGLRMTGPRPA